MRDFKRILGTSFYVCYPVQRGGLGEHMELVRGAREGRRPGQRAAGARGELWGRGGLVRGAGVRGVQGRGAGGRDEGGRGEEGRGEEGRGGRGVLPRLSQS